MTTKTIQRAISYIRCSTDQQVDAGNGLDAQRDAIAAYCEREGVELGAVHSDEGISGAKGIEKRPGLLLAITQLEGGDILLVAKRDRLGRDPIVLAMIERMVQKAGARIISVVGEGTDDDSPTSVLMRRIVDAFAEYERLLIGARTSAALQAKKARGERVGSIPFGYRLAENGRGILVDEGEQGMIRVIADLKAKEGLSLRAIAKRLTDRGLKPRGKSWHPQAVKRILDNQVGAGA